jgi:hypothetical protein
MKKIKIEYTISYEEKLSVPDNWEDDENFNVEDNINPQNACQTNFVIDCIEILEDN